MKCEICGQRKGKRSCPAKRSLICAQCCGEKRVLEIDCPETCQFLESGREYEKTVVGATSSRTSDPTRLQRHRSVLARFEQVVAVLEYMLADQRRIARDFTDEKAAESVRLQLETLKTENRGIVYERTSNDPLVESARRQLAEAIQRLRNPQQAGVESLRLGEAIEVLEFMLDMIQSHRGSRLSYVDYLLRLMPRRGALGSAGPSLIIPGR